MHFKLDQDDNTYSTYNGEIADYNKKNYNSSYFKNNNYEKIQQNYNKNKTQIIESNHYIPFKKKIDDNNKLNDINNDISSSMTLSKTEMGENNELLYQQNNNWISYQKQNSINSENNYYPKNKKNNFNQYRQKFKKGKNKKNNNYNNMNYLNMTDIMTQMPSNISYDNSKVDIPITNNNKIDINDLSINSNNNNQINNNIYQINNNIIFGQNNYYRMAQRNKGFFNNQILRDQNGINDYKNNYNYNYNKNLRQNYNLNKANMKNNNNRNKNLFNNFIPPKNNNYDLENLSIKKVNSQGSYSDQNYSKKLSNKFNTNNSLDNIVNFYNNPNFNPNNNFILNNNKDFFKNNNNFINHKINNNMNYTNIINNNINKEELSGQKEKSLRQLNIRIKLGENSQEKNIIIDINNENRVNIVNNIIKDNNLDQSYFEPLLNIIENSVNLLNNFDKLKLKKYNIKKSNESEELFKRNNLNDSFILYLIENNKYKKFADEIKPDKYKLKMKEIRNFSFNYKRNKFKNKLFFNN